MLPSFGQNHTHGYYIKLLPEIQCFRRNYQRNFPEFFSWLPPFFVGGNGNAGKREKIVRFFGKLQKSERLNRAFL